MSRLGLLFENSFSCRTPSLENLLSNNLKDKTEHYGISFTPFNISEQHFGYINATLPEVLQGGVLHKGCLEEFSTFVCH